VKGCRLSNKQFSIDTFHDWEEHHFRSNKLPFASSDHSISLVTNNNSKTFHLILALAQSTEPTMGVLCAKAAKHFSQDVVLRQGPQS